MPSVTIESMRFFGRTARQMRNAWTSTTSSATITGTLSHSMSNWMERIHAAFSSSDAATR